MYKQTSAKPSAQCVLKLLCVRKLCKTTVVLNNDAERVGVVELKSRLQVVVSPGQPVDPSTTYRCCYRAILEKEHLHDQSPQG